MNWAPIVFSKSFFFSHIFHFFSKTSGNLVYRRMDGQTSGWIQYTPIPPLVEPGYNNKMMPWSHQHRYSHHSEKMVSQPSYFYYGKPYTYPESKVHGANMGPIWGRQDPGGPRVGPMNFAIWVCNYWNGSYYKILPWMMISVLRCGIWFLRCYFNTGVLLSTILYYGIELINDQNW